MQLGRGMVRKMSEQRARGKRTWIKLYCYQRLHGSVAYQLSEEEQSVWDKLLCFAGLCGFDGMICDNDMRPFPHSFIAHEIHATDKLLENTLDKCKEEGRISEDGQGIKIVNWTAYQSEYDRQKPSRQKVLTAKAIKEKTEELGRTPTKEEMGKMLED